MSKNLKESEIIQNFTEKESYFAKAVIEDLFLEYNKSLIVKEDLRTLEILLAEANKEEKVSNRLFWTHANSNRLENINLRTILKEVNKDTYDLYKEISEYLKNSISRKIKDLQLIKGSQIKINTRGVSTVFLAITIYLLKNYDLAKVKLAFQKIQEVDSIEAADFWTLTTNDFDSSIPYEWLIASL